MGARQVPTTHARVVAHLPLFLRANGNNEHVLQTYMPECARPIFDHNLRPRRHSRQLITKTNMFNNNDFIIRMLYKDIY